MSRFARRAALALPLVAACRSPEPASLAIRHATVLDVRTGATRPGTTVLVRDGRIAAVLPDAEWARTPAARELDARGRLLTPGLIDAHHHVAYVFPDSITAGGGAIARLVMRPDSIAAYRRRWARAYLPYGVTAVREVGGSEALLPLMVAWMRPSPDAPDFFPSGGALVSHEEGRVPFAGHAVVRDPADAAARVRRYHALGLRDVKLYWRLRAPELRAALAESRRLGMHVTAHVDFGVTSLRDDLALGVRHFEHAYTIGVEAAPRDTIAAVWARTRETLGPAPPAGFHWGTLEHFNALGPADTAVAELIAALARSGATVTPTLHLFGQHVGATWFRSRPLGPFDDSGAWTPEQRARAARGWTTLSGYVRRLHEAGVPLAVGTDWLDPGKAVLSEMLVLHEAGIPMADVMRIATLGGARALEREGELGSVEPGRRASLVLWDASPLENPRALLGGKTVVKDGVVWRP